MLDLAACRVGEAKNHFCAFFGGFRCLTLLFGSRSNTLMNRNLRLLGFFLGLLPVLCSGQSGNRNGSAKLGNISGTVICQNNGRPLDKVTVALRPTNEEALASVFGSEGLQGPAAYRGFETESDQTGHFAFSNVPSGGYNIFFEKLGYVQEHADQWSAAPVTVRPGESDELTVPLQRAGVITGRVVDEDGEAMGHVYVQALRYRYNDGKRTLSSEGQAETNDLGEYRIYGLSPHKYYVRANLLGNHPSLRRGEQVRGGESTGLLYPAIYYPSSSTAGGAVRVDLSSGDEQHADISLIPTRAFCISARVTGAPTSPNAYTWVMLADRDREDRRGGRQVSGTEPSFTFDSVLPGEYWLLASSSVPGSDGERRNEKTGRIAVSVVASDIAGITLPLEPTTPATLQGRVRIDSRPTSSSAVSRLMVGFDVDDNTTIDGRTSVETSNVESDGTFSLTVNGDNGTAQPHITANGLEFQDYYTKSVIVGGHKVTDAGIPLSELANGRTIEVVLSPFGARVQGVVLDGDKKPRGRVFVACVPEGTASSRRELYITDTTDQQGHYMLPGLRPGSYKLYAFDDIDPGAIYSSEFLKPFEDMGESITVQEKDAVTKNLQVLHQTED